MEAAALARRTGCVRGASSSQPGEAGMQCVLLQCPAGVDSSIKWRRDGRCPGSTHGAALALIACYEQQSAWRGWRAVSMLQCSTGVDSSIRWRQGGRCLSSTHDATLAPIAWYKQQSAWRGEHAVRIAAEL